MKNNKLLTSLFVLGMGLSLVACGASDGGTTTKTDGTKTVEKKEEQKFADRKYGGCILSVLWKSDCRKGKIGWYLKAGFSDSV